MYLRALLLGGCIALTGCQSATVIEQSQTTSAPAVSAISQLQATQVKFPSSTKISMTPATQYLHNDQITSPVAVFDIPANRGQMSLTITSEITDSVFFPHVMITDHQGNIIESYDDSVFEYRKPRLNLGNRLVADLDFYPPQGHQSVYLVVYGKSSDLNDVTYVAHPGRIDAEARGNYMPELKDIAVPRAMTGTIELDVAGPGLFNFTRSGTPAKATSSDQAKMEMTVQPDTQAYYFATIEKAVEANDIPKALSLLDEAKALGIDGAQEIFVKAVNRKSVR